MHPLAVLDHRYVWHPFTQMRDWLRREPIVIVKGQGAELKDIHGKTYLDANSSIWTNLHGHRHPRMNAAIQKQLGKIAHSSALGFANEPASILAKRLIDAANRGNASTTGARRPPEIAKIFFSDDGSTAMEAALKLAHEFTRRTRGDRRPRFLSLKGAYHGDTVGAVSLGHIDLFHSKFSGLLFKTDAVPAPYCYRCPFNRAKPQRADARLSRKCNWECVDGLARAFSRRKGATPYAAFIFEPLMQGAAGMIAQPSGWLRRAAEIARSHGALLIADEVMTAFGRAGDASKRGNLFACQRETVRPDFIACAKGLTGGYLPMAATLVTQRIFDAFLGEYSEFKTFFHGHSYTGNQLGAAAAIASMDLLETTASLRSRKAIEDAMASGLERLWTSKFVGDIRRVGLMAGVELVKDWRTREAFQLHEQAGIRVCEKMAEKGVLTRPIGNVIVLMPPYCTSPAQVEKTIQVLQESVAAVFGSGSS